MSEFEIERDPADNLHTGHRQRMLETYLKSGVGAFSDVEALEFLLSYARPRVDTNVLAHRLLERFGVLHKVFTAPMAQLLQVEGVGERTAAMLCLIADMWHRSEESRHGEVRVFREIPEIGDYLISRIGGCREERAFLLSMDTRARMTDFREVSRGSISSVSLPFRRVVEVALMNNAAMVVLAHTHVGGSPIPSVEDIEYTRDLQRALRMVDVLLFDHIVVSERSYVSMRESKMIGKIIG